MKKMWNKKCSDWTGGDVIKFTVILSAVSYGLCMTFLWWGSICRWIDSAAVKVRDFFKPKKEDF